MEQYGSCSLAHLTGDLAVTAFRHSIIMVRMGVIFTPLPWTLLGVQGSKASVESREEKRHSHACHLLAQEQVRVWVFGVRRWV